MFEKRELLKEITDAQADSKKADSFIAKYTPFVRSEVLKNGVRGENLDSSDELSIAMFAFYEALINYNKNKGAFFPLAKIYIHNRIVDYFRKEIKKNNDISLDEKLNEDGDKTLIDSIEDRESSLDYNVERECTREEIEEFKITLKKYDLTLSDIASNSPKQKKTLNTCLDALECAKRNTQILEILEETKKLPIALLIKEGGFDRKTLERHRKYLVGILLAFTNGFVIIRDHLCKMRREEDEQ